MPIHSFHFLDYPETKKLFEILEKNNIEARFVGGCVRDSIDGVENSDLDLAINSGIERVQQILTIHGLKCIPTGIKYGSITAFINHRKFEITTLRKDEKCFGRDCLTASLSSFEEDAKRRDFTMNALYVSSKGELFDYFRGVDDLRRRRVVFIGDPKKRIQEDYLRIFRYYRFCAKYGDLSERYGDILKENAKHAQNLSIERIQKEMFLILTAKYSVEILRKMARAEIFSGIFKDYSIENLEKIRNIGCSLECKIYLFFHYSDLLSTLKLTRLQKRAIRDYKKFEKESLAYSYYKKGPAFLRDLIVIKYAKFNIQPDFSEKLGVPQKFPLTFKDLPVGIDLAGKKLQMCERWWAESGFSKDKKECIAFVSQIKTK